LEIQLEHICKEKDTFSEEVTTLRSNMQGHLDQIRNLETELNTAKVTMSHSNQRNSELQYEIVSLQDERKELDEINAVSIFICDRKPSE
jgi:peptidoglycan hydrolase CwlO-like protein